MEWENQGKEAGRKKGKRVVNKNKKGRNKKGESGIQQLGERMKMADGESIWGRLKESENRNLAEYERNAY